MDRTISIRITCYFYDINDNVISVQGPKHLENMPAGYIEDPNPGFNLFFYEGENVELIDYAKIIAVEE